ncbi:MAG: hypothetical protein NTW72_06880 [Gemmatimonadetes bacterium]|nr:hypothetical protein [Gemmatimonadota bacterium]
MRPIRSLLILLIAAPLAAQTALVSDATVRSSGGGVVAVLKQGTTVTVGAARGTDVFVTFAGWIDGSKLGGAKDSFPVQLTGTIAMRLRSAPSMKGVILGEIRPGTGLFTGTKEASWHNVRRGGWVDAKTLPVEAVKAAASAATVAPTAKPMVKQPAPVVKVPAPVAKAPAPVAKQPEPVAKQPAPVAKQPAPAAKQQVAQPPAVPPVEAAVVEAMPDGAMRVARSAVVRNAPNGLVVGQLAGGSVVVPLARSRGWVRVRSEVWVQERDVVPADSSFGASLSAADLRADPEGTRGKTVRWEVQVLALQVADPLRRDLAKDEPYFLAKGPGAEDQLLYLTIPPSLLAEARSIQALTRLLVTARVRTGRSQPVGIPILDILSLAKQ